MTPEINYTKIGDKLRTSQELNNDDRQAIMEIGIGFISEEMKSKTSTLWLVKQKSQEYEEYLEYVCLVRLAKSYEEMKVLDREAIKNHDTNQLDNLSEIKSVKLFKALKGTIINKLNITQPKENDFSLDDLIINIVQSDPPKFNVDEYIDIIGPKDMKDIISKAAGEIIPSNPRFSTYQGTVPILD